MDKIEYLPVQLKMKELWKKSSINLCFMYKMDDLYILIYIFMKLSSFIVLKR